MNLIFQLGIPLLLAAVWIRLLLQRKGERATNAPLRSHVLAQVGFEATFFRASRLGTRGEWIPLRGPKRLTVGTDAFVVSAPQALREFVFTGGESSIAFTRMPGRLAGRDRDWIVITGQSGGSQVQLAIGPDNLLQVWQALAGTGAAVISNEVPVRDLTRPNYSLHELAAVLVIALIADAVIWLGAIALPSVGAFANVVFFVAMIMFVVWLYRARVNADGHGWPQRRSPTFAVLGWLVPVVNFYFPYQIMADIWRAGLPDEERANPPRLPRTWWACWLAFFLLSALAGDPGNKTSYLVVPVKIAAVLTDIMTALLVQRVSNGPLGKARQEARTDL
jgi:uncharacterized membrane protein YtjA (UPF0391 family)